MQVMHNSVTSSRIIQTVIKTMMLLIASLSKIVHSVTTKRLNGYFRIGLLLCLMTIALPSLANPFEELRLRLQQEIQNQLQPSDITSVPNVIGMYPAQAEQLLNQAGLVLGKVEEVASQQASGKIVGQTPAANTQISAQSRVDVWVAKPDRSQPRNTADNNNNIPVIPNVSEPFIRVPSLTGLSLEKAKQSLRNAKLRLGDVVVKPSQSQKAMILDQHPPANKAVAANSVVDIILAEPQAPAEKPLQVILHLERNQLNMGETIQLRAETSKNLDDIEYSFNINGKAHKSRQATIRFRFKEAGRFPVTASARERGEKWTHSRSQWVTVIDTEQPTDAIVKVPDVVGVDLQSAIQALQEAGLKVGQVEQKTTQSLQGILEQRPVAGTTVKKGSAIYLVEATQALSPEKDDFDLTLAANKESVDKGEPVAFQVILSPMPEGDNVRYRFMINEDSFAKEANNWVHRFEESGQYTVRAEAWLGDKRIARSDSLTITIDRFWQEPKAIIKPANLVVSQGDKATFVSQSTHDKTTELRFAWTDESGQNSQEKEHTIDTTDLDPGDYWVSLRVKDKRGFESAARAQLIVVSSNETLPDTPQFDDSPTDTTLEDQKIDSSSAGLPVGRVQLELMASTKHILSGGDVKFSIVQFPAHRDPSKASYHIVYGDGEHEESNQPWIKHVYQSAGIHQAYVTTKTTLGLVQSKKVSIWVWPLWLLIGLVITLVLFLGRLLRPLFALSFARKKSPAMPSVVHVSYMPEKDRGTQQLTLDNTPVEAAHAEPSFDLTLQGDSDYGTQKIIHEQANPTQVNDDYDSSPSHVSPSSSQGKTEQG